MHDVTMKLVAAVTEAVAAAAAVVSPGLAAAVAVTAVAVAAVTAAAAELQLAYDWLSALYWRHRSATARWSTPLRYD